MDKCFKCGVLGDKTRLFDAILDEGIFKICEECASKENMPLVKKPVTFQLKDSESGPLKYREYLKKFEQERVFKNELLKKQETTLKDIVDRNVVIKMAGSSGPRLDLIDNFHWIIMRARRAKKLTQAQLAEEIAESEAAIGMIEKGVVPEDDYRLVNKLENYLGVRLVKEEVAEEMKKQPKRLDFDSDTTKILTISDLQEMKKKREAKILGEEEILKKRDDEPEFDEEDLFEEEKELSDEEMDEIIFGKDKDNK